MSGSRILIVSSEVGRGLHFFVAEDIRHLSSRGWSIGLLSWGRKPNLKLTAFHKPSFFNFKFINSYSKILRKIKNIRDLKSSIAIAALASGVSAAMGRSGYDVVHAHFAFPEGIAAVVSSARPILITVHGYDVQVAPNLNYGIRLRRFGDELVREALNSADLVMVANEYMKKEVSKISRTRVEIVPNGVDTSRFRPDLRCPDWGLKNYVFALKQHTRRSGFDVLLRAFASLRDRGDLFLVIGGKGPLTKEYIRMAMDLGISDRVIFTGRIPYDELPCYYRMSLFVVVPSLVEAFGLSATEAMASGKAVIVSDTGGLREQVEDGYNGFRFPPGDWERLSELMEMLVDDPGLARELGENGRSRVLERYDMRIRISKLEEIYRHFT